VERITISVTPDMFSRLHWLAAKREIPVSGLVRDACEAYMKIDTTESMSQVIQAANDMTDKLQGCLELAQQISK